MIIISSPNRVITNFLMNLNIESAKDYSFMSNYLNKALSTLCSVEELIEYCSEEFYNYIPKGKLNQVRAYPLSSLQRDKYFELLGMYKVQGML